MGKQTVKIFIASSSEVGDERKKCILLLNEINNSHPHLDLKTVEWEYDLPKGSFPDFESIQKAINPLLNECNFCVFIFNSKIGKYTKEEFELTNQHKKKLFAFFKEGFSPKTKDEVTKWAELLEFKESLNDTILYVDYTDLENFELNFNKSLHLYLTQVFSPITIYEDKPLSAETSVLVKIITRLQNEIDELKKLKELPNQASKEHLALLEKERQELQDKLNESKEFQEQQAKDKSELEMRLQPQIAKDNLKQKAFTAIQENKLDDAKALLLESAKDTFIDVASTYYELGKISKLQLNYKEALRYFEFAVNLNPNDFGLNMETGKMYNELGLYKKSIFHYEKCLELSGNNARNLSYANNQLGLVYNNVGKHDKAIDYYEKALSIDKKIFGEEDFSVATSYNNLAAVYWKKEEHDKAIEFSKKCLKILDKLPIETAPFRAVSYSVIGLANSGKGEYSNAIRFYNKALKIDKENFGIDHPKIATRYNNLGVVYVRKENFNKAIGYYEMSLNIIKKYYGEEHPKIAACYTNLGIVYLKKTQYEKAIDYYEKSLNIDQQFLGEEHINTANDYYNIGYLYHNKNQLNDAIEYYKRALIIFRQILSEKHQQIIIAEENLAIALEALKNQQKNVQKPPK